MHRRSSWFRFFCLCLFGTATSYATASPLSEAFFNAKTFDETYLSALANFEASQELIPQAIAPLLPNISVSAQNMSNQLNKNEGAGPLPQQNYRSSSKTLALRQSIIRPAAWVQVKQSSAQVMSAQYELLRAENELATRVVSAYLDTLLAQDQLKATNAQIKALQTQQAATNLGLQQGYATRVDVAEVQSRLDLALADQMQIHSAKKFAQEQLLLFSGQTQVLPLKVSINHDLLPESMPTPQVWLESALEKNFDILVSKFRVKAAEQEVVKSHAGHLPTLDVVAQVSNSNNENIQFPATTFSNKQIGLQLNVPLLSGGSVLSAGRQASLLATKEARLLNATTNNVRLQITKEYNNFVDGLQRIKANEASLSAAQHTLISMEKNRDAGYKSDIDVLNAKQKVLSSEKDLILARYQCVLGLLKLHLLSGESAEQALIKLEQFVH